MKSILRSILFGESPNLFVLLDRPRTTMLIFPKRVFPHGSAEFTPYLIGLVSCWSDGGR